MAGKKEAALAPWCRNEVARARGRGGPRSPLASLSFATTPQSRYTIKTKERRVTERKGRMRGEGEKGEKEVERT
jgi:hypothetical protein